MMFLTGLFIGAALTILGAASFFLYLVWGDIRKGMAQVEPKQIKKKVRTTHPEMEDVEEGDELLIVNFHGTMDDNEGETPLLDR